MTNEEIISRWKDQPAPFLAVAHSFLERDGYISGQALSAIGEVVGKSPGFLGVVLGGYRIFPQAQSQQDPPKPLAPVQVPAPNPTGTEECLFRSIRTPNQKRLDIYQQGGGYEALAQALKEQNPETLLECIEASGLAGRGGAGFSTGKKWRAVAQANGESKVVVCNGDEGEPGCFKDRVILELDPHSVIEGMALAALATGASLGIIYLRNDFAQARGVLETAIEEATGAALLGDRILDTDFSFSVHVRLGAGTYMCGEETVLLNTLEGNHPLPRNRPPYPANRGFENRPTLINNVETLAAAAKIAARGADWYQALGLGKKAGTKIVSVSGDIKQPGNYEIPIGLPLRDLIADWVGGPLEGRSIQAVAMAGASGGFLGEEMFGCKLDDSLVIEDTLLGAGGIVVYDNTRDMVQLAREQIQFFDREMCGKCEPCQEGLEQLREAFDFKNKPASFKVWRIGVEMITKNMDKGSICGLGKSAALTPTSMLRYFSNRLETAFNESP